MGRLGTIAKALTVAVLVLASFPSLALALSSDPFGYLDVVERRADGIRVAGWVIHPLYAASIGVQIWTDGALNRTVTANQFRPDVGAAYPGYGDFHGFDTVIPGGSSNICVYPVFGGSATAALGCRAVNADPFGHLDVVERRAGEIRVAGWAIDPDTTSSIAVHVYADGAFSSSVTANQSRPDVGAAHPGYGNLHGFELLMPAGASNVCVYGINQGPGSVNTALGCRAVNVDPFGHLDVASRDATGIRVAGWAIDPDTTSSLAVHIYADGVFHGSVAANQSRPDVGTAHPGYGDSHGFDAVMPDVAASSICAYAINQGPGSTNTWLGCIDVGLPCTCFNNPPGVLHDIPDWRLLNGAALPQSYAYYLINGFGNVEDVVRIDLEDGARLNVAPNEIVVVLNSQVQWAKEIVAWSLCDGSTSAVVATNGANSDPTNSMRITRASCIDGCDTIVFRKVKLFGVMTDMYHLDITKFWRMWAGKIVTITWFAD